MIMMFPLRKVAAQYDVLVILQFFIVVVMIVNAEKDSDYYYPGFVNPNTDNPMYWKDSINVLQDIDQFQALYIRYHHCVWSKYGSRYGSGEDYEGDDEDEEDNDNGCGGYGGEYFWYMGRTQCFKANVAYSLYGILKTDKNANNIDASTACSKKTYINSFFTTFGVESFAGPLGMGIDDANSECTMDDNGAGGDKDAEEEYEDAAADDDYLEDDYEYYNYAEYTSYGTGCSDEGKFVMDQYTGAFCHGKNYQQTLDTMDDFNTAIEAYECTQIYDASNNNNNNRKKKNRALEEEDYHFDEMDPIDILSFSKSCSLRQYPKDCPDPYGLKKQYGKRIERAFEYKTGKHRNTALLIAQVASYLCLAAGVNFLVLAFCVHRNKSNKKRRRWWLFGKNKDNKSVSNKSVSSKNSKISISKKQKQEPDGTQPSIFEEIASKGSEFSNSVSMPWSTFGGNDNNNNKDNNNESSLKNDVNNSNNNKSPTASPRTQRKKMEVEMAVRSTNSPGSPSSRTSSSGNKKGSLSPKNFFRKKFSKK